MQSCLFRVEPWYQSIIKRDSMLFMICSVNMVPMSLTGSFPIPLHLHVAFLASWMKLVGIRYVISAPLFHLHRLSSLSFYHCSGLVLLYDLVPGYDSKEDCFNTSCTRIHRQLSA